MGTDKRLQVVISQAATSNIDTSTEIVDVGYTMSL